jgi:hypothetical protein
MDISMNAFASTVAPGLPLPALRAVVDSESKRLDHYVDPADNSGARNRATRVRNSESIISVAPIFDGFPFFANDGFTLNDCNVTPILAPQGPRHQTAGTLDEAMQKKYMQAMFRRPSFCNLTEAELKSTNDIAPTYARYQWVLVPARPAIIGSTTLPGVNVRSHGKQPNRGEYRSMSPCLDNNEKIDFGGRYGGILPCERRWAVMAVACRRAKAWRSRQNTQPEELAPKGKDPGGHLRVVK